jgi:hypothetical protein
MLGKHPLHNETPHDVAIKNHLANNDSFMAKDPSDLAYLNLYEDHPIYPYSEEAHHLAEQQDPVHHNDATFYKVFLEDDNSSVDNLYRSFGYQYLPIPIVHQHSRIADDIYEEEPEPEEDEWFSDVGKAARLAHE